jgi:enediyne biosynthesis protein E4
MPRSSPSTLPQRLMVIVAAVLAAALASCRPPPPGTPAPEPLSAPVEANWFEDVTDQVGLTFVHDAGPTGQFFMPQSMLGGCALFDADGDGRLDLLLLQGAGPGTGKGNELWLQTAEGKFRNASAGSGLDIDGYNVGVAIGDVDNDGRPDVLITRYVGAKLFRNEGGGKFRDITAAAGIDNPVWGASAAFFDYDRDGWLDLVITNYLDYDRSWPCTAPDGSRDFCGPRTFPGTVTRLFHNLGPAGGTSVHFRDVTVASGLAAKASPGLGVYCADLTADGWPDVFVTNDGKPNHLWVNQRDGTFKEEALSRGVALTGTGSAYANMGIAPADYDGDGRTDLFVTHLGTETHTLWQQGRAGLFTDRTAPARVTQTRWRGTGFGVIAADFDRDGRPDIAFVNGRVYRGPTPANVAHLPEFWRVYAERNQILRNAGGTFEDVSEANPAFCGRANVGRGLAVGDVDGDGRPDLLVLATADRARLYRNVAPGGHWLGIRAVDPGRGGRDLYGTEVRVTADGRTLLQMVQPGQSYLSSSAPELLFGLGGAATYDRIEVTWPDGRMARFNGGAADRRVVVRPGEGEVP